MTSNDSARIRLSFNVTPAVREQLESLQEQSGAETLTEVLRRSLALYEIVLDTRKRGGKVLTETKSGKRESIVLL